MSDKLDMLFNLQTKLMKRYVNLGFLPQFPLDLSVKNDVKTVRECVFHITQELFEAIYHLKNRPNRVSEIKDFNREEYEEELVDALHLFLELLILSNIDADKITNLYISKNDKNNKRVDEKY